MKAHNSESFYLHKQISKSFEQRIKQLYSETLNFSSIVIDIDDVTLVPWVLETRVFPTFLWENEFGAFTSYQSFLEKGSTLKRANT